MSFLSVHAIHSTLNTWTPSTFIIFLISTQLLHPQYFILPFLSCTVVLVHSAEVVHVVGVPRTDGDVIRSWQVYVTSEVWYNKPLPSRNRERNIKVFINNKVFSVNGNNKVTVMKIIVGFSVNENNSVTVMKIIEVFNIASLLTTWSNGNLGESNSLLHNSGYKS